MPASTGCTPADCVTSQKVRTPWRAAAAVMASTSATSPVADCTCENTAIQVFASRASASSARGTERTVMSSRWRNGKTMELKSPWAISTVAPGGTAAATTLVCTEVCDPMAIRSGVMPTRSAKDPRVRSMIGS
jgi:hypothetical protein